MKPLFVISSPFDTYSGYGARSRDLIKAIIETDKYTVRLLSQRWGATPFGFCKNNPEWEFLLDLTLPTNQLPKQPEIWAQVTIPSEFQPIGKYNIGFTAGIETTIAPADWIEGMNRMDLNIVSSEHSKQIFLNSQFEKRNRHTNALESFIKLEKPVEVLFEGVNTDVYKVLEKNTNKNIDLSSIKEDFAYLFVGHWIAGDMGEDRKNVGLLVKAFYEIFKNKSKKPALILKTSQVGSSYVDREEILKKIKQIKSTVNSKNLPNVYLLHGEFTDEEMNELYNNPKVKAMVNLTKGEGFGRPLLEFSIIGKPIIASGWSGHLDFLTPELCGLVGGTLTNVHQSAHTPNLLLKESQWFKPDDNQVGHAFLDIFDNYKKYQEKAKELSTRNKRTFSLKNMDDKMGELLAKYVPEFTKVVELKLPTLKKINND